MSKVAIVTGGASGLGALIVKELVDVGFTVHIYDKEYGDDVVTPDLQRIAFNCENGLDVLVNCAGVNKINWLEKVTDEDWDDVMGTNAKGIFKMTQACLPHLVKTKGVVLNIVSNASHMPMTCSLAYNASKGAAEIMTKQLARELTRAHGITVFGISPNKLANTNMSRDIDRQVVETRGWTPEQAHQYQLQGLLVGEETDPVQVAKFAAFLLKDRKMNKPLSGCIMPFGV